MLGRGTRNAYRAVRQRIPPLLNDRPLEPDIRAVREVIGEGFLLASLGATLKPIPELGPVS
jgi:histidine ammonia-lyase